MVTETLTVRAARFKALGDPLRLTILDRLSNGPSCVCDLRDGLDIAGNLLSHHLKVLREAGLVRAEREGRWVTYHLEPAALAAVREAVPGPAAALSGA